MVKVKRALISVSDKKGLEEFAKGLRELGVEILSTGGTAKLIKNLGIPVKLVSDYTGFPEMLDGRVKTLHPKIHGALLALRDNPEHMKAVQEHGIELIDMVVVNLYPFERTIQRENVKLEEAIEQIDIGGPSMLRSAAKNFNSVAVVCNPDKYSDILKELRENDCTLRDETSENLAAEVFKLTSNYDRTIAEFLKKKIPVTFPEFLELRYEKVQDLRYGENPHQKAAFYIDLKADETSISRAKQLHGKELSFNNFLDLNSALEIVKEFDEPSASVIKHTNPCGAASAKTLAQAFKDALDCDRLSAFGSVVGLNRKVDVDTAEEIVSAGFVECVVAPAYEDKAIEIFKQKKNLRILKVRIKIEKNEKKNVEFDLKKISGGLLIQEPDLFSYPISKNWKVVTQKKPSDDELKSLLFGWKIAKWVKSNAIVLCQSTKTVGIGAGQMSRVDSVIIAARKAGEKAKGSVLASDAFFPKADGVRMAVKAGVVAIVQPGGSISDDEIIKAADGAGISMVFTEKRHFKH